MWSDFGELLALALGIAFSPLPVLGVILMLLSPRGMRAGMGFAVGWLGGVAFAVIIFSLLSSLLPDREDEGTRLALGLLPVVLGAALIAFGFVKVSRRAIANGDDDEAAKLPRWLGAVDRLNGVRGVVLGFGYALLRPKNLVITVAAGIVIGRADAGLAGTAISVGAFTALASVTIVAPPLASALGGERVRTILVDMRTWMLAHLGLIAGATLIVVGAALVIVGLVTL